MSWYPHATKRELSFAHALPARQNAASAVIHTNGGKTSGGGDLHDWWESQYRKTGDRICCHLQIGWAESFQYVDSTRQAFAAYDSNPFAFQIETEDDGDPSTPWNDYQVATIVGACFWLKVPARISPDNASGGVGWHQQYANWNQSRHNCPGKVRVEQIHDLVIPRLAATYEGDDMAGVMVPLPDNYPYKDHKPGDLVPIDKYLEILGHQVFAIREVVQQDIAVDKQDAAVDRTQK